MKKLIILCIGLLLISAPSLAQEEENLTDEEKAYRDSIAALNEESETMAKARELFNEGNALFESKKYDQAIAKFGESIKTDPEFVEAYYNKGVAEIESKKYSDAILTLTAYVAKEPNGKGYFQRALANQEAGKITAAEKDYEKAKELDPDNEKIPYNFGVMKFMQNDFEGALEEFNAAIETKPDFAFAWNDKGSCYRQMGQYAEAVKAYEEAEKRNPKLAFVLSNLGKAKRLMGDNEGALSAYNRAMSIDPNFVLAYLGRGAVLFEQGKHTQAVQDFEKALQIAPDNPLAYNNMAGIKIKKEDWTGAEKDASKAIQLDPNYANAYVNRGIAREMLRKEQEACQDWAKARELGSDAGKIYQSSNCQ